MQPLGDRSYEVVRRTPGPRRQHQWEHWFQCAASGEDVLLVRGEHFAGSARGMSQQAYAAGAAAVGVIASVVRTKSGRDAVLLHAHDRD